MVSNGVICGGGRPLLVIFLCPKSVTYLPTVTDSVFLWFESSHQFPHVAGWRLRGVDASSLLPPRHPPPQLVVSLQDGFLGRGGQLSEDCLAGAGARRALAVNMIYQGEISEYLTGYLHIVWLGFFLQYSSLLIPKHQIV